MLPHFIMEQDLMADSQIKSVMEIMYGQILVKIGNEPEIDPRSLLLLLLASVIYHSDRLQDIILRDPGHPFSLIPLLTHPELPCQLRAEVSKAIVVWFYMLGLYL